MTPAEQFEVENRTNPTGSLDEQAHTDSHGDSAVFGRASILFDEQAHTDSHGDGPLRNPSDALFDEQYHSDSHGDGPARGFPPAD